jgi:hypothetical protein
MKDKKTKAQLQREKAQLQREKVRAQAEEKLRLKRSRALDAIYTTDDVSPDVPPPESGSGYSYGWDYNPYLAKDRRDDAVFPAWSSSTGHGHNKPDRYTSGTQGAKRLYSTKLRAWYALRRELEYLYGDILAFADDQANVAAAAAETQKEEP